MYGTLGDVPLDGTASTCQSYGVAMPAGWRLAPDTPDTRALISMHTWSTEVIALGDGIGYWTTSGIQYGYAAGNVKALAP